VFDLIWIAWINGTLYLFTSIGPRTTKAAAIGGHDHANPRTHPWRMRGWGLAEEHHETLIRVTMWPAIIVAMTADNATLTRPRPATPSWAPQLVADLMGLLNDLGKGR
jgi:hypothetical protein